MELQTFEKWPLTCLRRLKRADTVRTLTDHKDNSNAYIAFLFFQCAFFSRKRENAVFIPGLESISLRGEG